MLFTKTKPCNQCPFRRASAAGWLGDATPEEFIASALADELMPCHSTVNYESKNWKSEMAKSTSKVQHCAGARIMYANQCKRSKHPTYMKLDALGKIKPVEPSKDVFTWRQEFLSRHNGPVRMAEARMEHSEDDEREVVCHCGNVYGSSFDACPACNTPTLENL
jgi:hypothetical protein